MLKITEEFVRENKLEILRVLYLNEKDIFGDKNVLLIIFYWIIFSLKYCTIYA